MKLRSISLGLMFVAVCFGNAFVAQAQTPAQTKDKIISTKTVQGKLINFETGDYRHVTIRKANGKTASYWLGEYGLDYFLAVNRGKNMTLTYEVVDSYIPEAGGGQRIERIKSAKVGIATFENWLKTEKKKLSADKVDAKYQALVAKYTKS